MRVESTIALPYWGANTKNRATIKQRNDQLPEQNPLADRSFRLLIVASLFPLDEGAFLDSRRSQDEDKKVEKYRYSERTGRLIDDGTENVAKRDQFRRKQDVRKSRCVGGVCIVQEGQSFCWRPYSCSVP